MKATFLILVFLSVTRTATFAQPPDDLQRQFDEAERRIVRLQPAAFLELPRAVRQELQHTGAD
jgi:hypothetical protein